MKIWCNDFTDATYTDAAMLDVKQFRGLRFFRGVPLGESFPDNATIEVRTKRPPTDFFRAGIYWIISTKLRSILDSQGVAAEYFPIRVVNKKGKPLIGEWWCFNATLVVDWLDWSNSQFVVEQNTAGQNFATNIKKITTKPIESERFPLSVAERTIPILVAVSDQLAEAIVESGCTGILFQSAEEWRDPACPGEQ